MGDTDTTAVMANDKDKKKADDKKKPAERSPAWPVYARLDLELKEAFEEYQSLFEYAPDLARVIERAMKKLFEEAKVWPRKPKRNGH